MIRSHKMNAALLCSVVDYGMGNLPSVIRASRRLAIVLNPRPSRNGCEPPPRGGAAGRLGVFGEAMHNLAACGLVKALEELVLRDRQPLLAICLGMQLLARNSDEEGFFDGLAGSTPKCAGSRRMTGFASTCRLEHPAAGRRWRAICGAAGRCQLLFRPQL